MMHPSYSELMDLINQESENRDDQVVNSRYAIVMATAKRARQIVDGDEPLIHVSAGEKPLSIAVEELNQEKIHILAESAIVEEAEDELEDREIVEEVYEGENAEEAEEPADEPEASAEPEEEMIEE